MSAEQAGGRVLRGGQAEYEPRGREGRGARKDAGTQHEKCEGERTGRIPVRLLEGAREGRGTSGSGHRRARGQARGWERR